MCWGFLLGESNVPVFLKQDWLFGVDTDFGGD
jgi:hypothetical protein